ncbi:hypothetical protein ABZX51_002511 [Aspergillus tubingensis]
MVPKFRFRITTTPDNDVYALIVNSQDENFRWPLKLYQLVEDEWVLSTGNEYLLDVFPPSPVCGWFHDPGSEKHGKLIGYLAGSTELRISVTEDSQWETRPYTDEVQKAICIPGAYGPYGSYTTPCTTANHNSDVALEYIDWQWAFCVPKMYFVNNLYELHRKSNDSDWQIKLIDEVESGKAASCINTGRIDVYFIEDETGNGWTYHKAYDGEEYTKTPLGQPGDYAGVTELCAVSTWFGEPRMFGLSDGYLKEFQYNKLRTHIVGTPITTAHGGVSSLSATIEQDRHNSPETIRLAYFPDDQDIMGTYVWTQAEGWKPGPQIV